jgi:ribonuclease BN (tRNA processing enzyme)
MPDHGPGCSSLDDDFVPQDVIDLCNGADLLIHDAQHTLDEYPEKRHWGHSSVNYAVKVAISGRVRSLALFHHDPMHDDAEIDSIEQYAAEIARSDGAGLEVFAARDGLELKIEPTLLDLTPQVERADR